MKAAERKDAAAEARRDHPAHEALRVIAVGKRAKGRWIMETCFVRRACAAKPARAA